MMPISQQKLRELVFQLLYSSDFTEGEPEEMAAFMLKNLSTIQEHVDVADQKRALIEQKKAEIDQLITDVSHAYRFERISSVEKNILRLGVFEMMFAPGFPPKVAMSEAVRLTRKFSSPEGASFVNAIMDAIYKCSLKKESASAS
jgi:transcription antitermination protein NusB